MFGILALLGFLLARPEDTPDSSLSCRYFREIAEPAGKGLFTDYELREELKKVYDRAAGATDEVRAAAEAMLRDITNGGEIADDIHAMGDACEAEGF